MKAYYRVIILFLLISFVFAESSDAQSRRRFKRWEGGGMIGTTNYLGEIGGNLKTRRDFLPDLQFPYTKPTIGGYIIRKIKPELSLRGNLVVGWIGGSDQLSENYGRHLRNASFKSILIEASGQAEYNFISWRDIFRKYLMYRNRKNYNITAYGFAGAGFFYFDPRTEYQGKTYRLQPMGTEGQGLPGNRKRYSLIQPVIPMGLGLFFSSRYPLRISFEIGHRLTFTDYLDDVSTTFGDPVSIGQQYGPVAGALANRTAEDPDHAPEDLYYSAPGQKRGDPTHKDSYFFTVVKVGYAFNGKKRFKYRPKF